MKPYAQLNRNEKIEAFLQTIEATHAAMDPSGFWPAPAACIEAYFGDILAVDLFEKFKKDQEQFARALNRIKAEILKLTLYSGWGQIGLKVAKKFEGYQITTKQISDFVVGILDAVARQRPRDPLCLGGTNPVLSRQEIGGLLDKPGWEGAGDPKLKKAVAGLNITAESLTWSLFYDINRCGGMRIHGPYQTAEGTMVVRDFFDLAPPLWKLKNQYPKLQTCLIYDEGIDIQIDFANHIVYDAPIINRLQLYRIVADRPLRTLDQIKKLDDYYSARRKRQTAAVNALEPAGIIKKGAEIAWYLLGGFWDFYGQDWQPSELVAKRIKGLGLKYWRRYQKPRPHTRQRTRLLFDPRNGFID